MLMLFVLSLPKAEPTFDQLYKRQENVTLKTAFIVLLLKKSTLS